jgi:CTP:molybdopterin cytidylyltransferase MocA
VVEHYRRTHAPIVRPVNGDRHGHPLVIDRMLFEALRRGDDAQGAKPIVRAHASTLGDVEIQDEGAFVDIDTMEEYRRLVSRPFPVDSRLSR